MNKLKIILNELNEILVVPGIYDAITAKLSQENNFNVAWVSGFSVSTSLFLPDDNSLSLEKYVERIAEIKRASSISLIVDCDEGYGEIHKTITLFQSLSDLGVEACCIEDNLFPKANSFKDLGKAKRAIQTKESFAEKITILKNKFPQMLLVARTESLIAGESLQEATSRAKLYKQSGADLIVIHSKSKTIDEFRSIGKSYGTPHELIVIPTLADNLTSKDFNQLGYRIVIYANHIIRGNIFSTNGVLKKIGNNKSINALNRVGATMNYIFDLTDKQLKQRIDV